MSEEKKSASTKSSNNASNHSDDAAAEPKPVIITHRPILKDPALNVQTADAKEPDEVAEPKKMSGSSIDFKLKPLEQSPAPEAKPKKTEDTKPAETPPTVNDEVKTEPDVPGKDTEIKDADTKDADEKPAAESDKPTAGNLSPEELEAKESEKQAKHDAAIQKIVDDKTYFLPINAVEKRRTKRFVILGIVLSLVLAIAWVDIALDAGLIHINGIQPATHFFSN